MLKVQPLCLTYNYGYGLPLHVIFSIKICSKQQTSSAQHTLTYRGVVNHLKLLMKSQVDNLKKKYQIYTQQAP